MKRAKKTMLSIIGILVAIFLITFIILWINSPGKLKPLKNSSGKVIENSITEKEVEWFNLYHKYVYDRLSPLLAEDEKVWLKEKTDEI